MRLHRHWWFFSTVSGLGEVRQVRHTSPNPSENVRRVIFISHHGHFSAYITADTCDRLSAPLRGSPRLEQRDLLGCREDGVQGGEVLSVEAQACRLCIGAHLLGAGRTGNDGGDRRLLCEPGERRLHLGDAALGAEAVEGFELVPVGGVEHVLLGVGQARTGGNVVAAVLAGQQTVSEREVRQHTHAEVLCGGQDFEFCAAVEQVVVVFCGDEPFGAEFVSAVFGVGELPAGEVGVAQVADFAVAYELVEGAEGFFDGGVRVGAVVEVQVDVVGAEAAEGPFDGAHDVAAGSAGVAVVAVEVTDGQTEFGDDGQFVAVEAELGEGGAEHGFGEAGFGAVEVGDVEEADAGVNCGGDDFVGAFLGAGGGAGAAEVVAADADAGYDEAGVAEPAVDGRFNTFHAFNSTLCGYVARLFPFQLGGEELSEA